MHLICFLITLLFVVITSFFKCNSYITGSAVFAGTMMCMIMGLVGYLSFGNNTEGMILDNFPQHGFDFFKVRPNTPSLPFSIIIMRPDMLDHGSHAFNFVYSSKLRDHEVWNCYFLLI